jgi:lysophospholipase L1-like esterase
MEPAEGQMRPAEQQAQPGTRPAPTLRRRLRSLGINLSISLISLVIFFALAEGLARLGGYAPYEARADAFQREFDESDRSAIGMFIQDPSRIWDLRPGYTGHRDDWGGRNWVTITINLQGRRDAEVLLAKPANTTRIALLGDSVAFGARVMVQDDFASLMQATLNAESTSRHYEVLNFGVSGYSTWQELSVFNEKALPYQPDVAILAFVMNDLVDNNQASRLGFLDMTRAQGVAQWLREHSAFYRFLREQVLSVEARMVLQDPCANADPNFCWDNTRRLLDQMDDATRKAGVPLVIVVFPTHQQISDPDPALDARYQEILAAYARERGIPLVDLLPAFRAEGGQDTELYVDDYHPNERGHVLTARVILEELRAQGILPAP